MQIAALSQMTTMTASKGEGKQVIIFSQGASSPGRPTREKAESAMSRRTAKTLRYGRRHGPRLLRENEELKSEVVRLKKETKQQSNQIMSLEEELESVNRRLVEERQITSKLEDIRNLLRRKSTLQERRIHVFEQKMSMQIMEQELVGKTIQENGLPFLERSAEARNRYDVAGREFAVGDQETCIQISEKVISRRSWEHTREHTLNESLEEDEIYLLEEDEESTISQESAKQMLNKVRQNNLATSSKNGQNASISGELISKINAIDNLASCECQQSFLSSEHKEKIDFYLPTLSVSCLCGKQQFKLLSIPTDLKRVDSILRTWQTEFLASIGIVEIEDFILTHRNQEKELVRSLHKWRASKGLETMRKRACAAALLVWARTCSMAVRYQNGEAVNWSKTSHQLLKIASMDSGKVFH